MEPLDDRELSEILHQWEAPGAPPTLRERVLPARQTAKKTIWRWLLTGTIRVPVPVGVAAGILLAFWIYSSVATKTPENFLGDPGGNSQPVSSPQARPVTLADFQPVAQLQPRIVGEQ